MKKHAKKLLAVLLTLGLLLGLLPTAAFALDEPTHTHDSWVAVTMGTTYIKLGDTEQTSNALPAGSYYLDGDISVPLSVIGEVNLCLNDHDVKVTGNNSRAITITSEAALNLYDCPGANYGGTVLGQDAGISNNGGTVHVYGGTVKGNSVGIKNNVNSGRMTNFVYVHGGEVNGSYGIQNLSAPCEVHVSGGSVTGSINGIRNMSVYDNKIYLSGTPTISGNRANGHIYTDGSSSPYIYADDGASENPTPYTGDTIILAYNSLNTSSSATAVCHVTAASKDKFSLTQGDYNFHLEFTKYSSSSAQNDCLKITAITYTVTFNSNGGSAVDAKSVVSGNRVSKPTDPTKSGFVFGGWYSDEELTQAYDFTSSVTDDLTLYAKWSDAPAHSHAVSVGCEADSGTQVEFTAWGTADAMPDTAGNYVLTCDVEMASAWTVPSGTTNLCLNGHVLSHTGSSYVIHLQDGRTLNLCDCQTTEHKFTSNDYGNWSLDPNGDKTATGGVITSCKSPYTSPIGVNIRGGNLTMYGGNIVGNTQGVCLSNWSSPGSFTMEGGSIQGNYGADGGAGVKISGEPTTTFTMKGGAIANNTADGRDGGGVCLMKGVFNLEGGSVANNRSLSTSSMGGGVKVFMNGTFNMTGGSITGNSATHGGGIYMNGDAKVTLSGGSITGNQAGYQQLGGGIYYDGAYVNSGYLRLKGAPVIKDNTRGGDGAASDIYLAGGAVMTIGARDAVLARPAKPIVIGASGAKQTVTTVTSDWGNRMYSGEEYKNYANYFKSDSSDYALGLETTHYEVTLGPSQVTPTTYTVTFNANGHGTAPASITNVTSGSKITAPTPPTAQGWTFGGWYQEAACTNPWVFETNTVTDNVTLYAKWTEVPSNPTYDISGTVTDESTGGNATVTLMRGNTVISTQEITLAATGVAYYHGNYSFTGVEPGVYNVVARSGDRTKTILVVLTNANAERQDIRITSAKQNSMVEVKGAGTPAVVVGGVDQVAELERPGAGETVTVKLTVEKKAESAADNANDIKAVAGNQTLDFLELKLEKTVTDGANPETTTDITDTGSTVIEIVVPFTFTNRQNVTVYRYHVDSAEALDENDSKGGGTFRLDTAGGLIHIYATKFSTYAIGYTSVSAPSGGSGGGTSSYAVTVEAAEHGAVKTSHTRASSGSTVTVTPVPEEGYVLASLTVTDNQGGEVKLIRKDDGAYTFTMPARKVTVTVVFAPEGCPLDSSCPIAAFEDTDVKGWYHDGVHYCLETGVMNGRGEGLFDPEGTTTRGMLTVMLWRSSGSPVVNYAMDFRDVAEGTWYTEAVRWAASEQIVLGYGNGTFGPEAPVTREQMVTILWRYARYKGLDVSAEEPAGEPAYGDVQSVSEFAVSAMEWACASGLVMGKPNPEGGLPLLDPAGSATRAETATIMMRYLTKIIAE